MSDYRLDAYYYGFEPTKNAAIDKILGAVACAGKAYHHTQDWDEEVSPYDDHTGKTPTEWIQNAAIEAADEIERLRAGVCPCCNRTFTALARHMATKHPQFACEDVSNVVKLKKGA